MLSLKCIYGKPEYIKRGKRIEQTEGKAIENMDIGAMNTFGFEPVKYQMQTNMIGRLVGGYTCGGCSRK